MKKAFTLSEVLITLGIIGMVAIMTIPSFVKNYKKKVYASKISKAYSQILYATGAIMAEEHTKRFSLTTGGGSVCDDSGTCKVHSDYFLDTYFKMIKKDCKNTCIASKYITPEGTDAGTISDNFTYCSQTANGAAICHYVKNLGSVTSTNSYEEETQNNETFIAIDTNGAEEPNITGYDLFFAKIEDNGQLSDLDTADNCNKKTVGNGAAQYASGCLAKIILDEWKINY